MLETSIVNIGYLIGTIMFVIGLIKLGSPDTARRGNTISGIGMGIGILCAMWAPFQNANNNYAWIIGAMLIGGIIGYISAKKVKMTDMPQMVSVFNGLGGATAVLLAVIELYHHYHGNNMLGNGGISISIFALVIGSVSFTGSLLAFGKLQGLIKDKHVTLPKHSIINLILLAVVLVLSVMVYLSPMAAGYKLVLILTIVSLVYGFSFVAPIGGADMPVVISLLNSFTGLSASAAGMVYGNNLMIVGGILVGASGTILTILMCNAMNRSLLSVIIGGFGAKVAAKGVDGDQVAKELTPNDAAIQLFYADSVIFVPGYGLAVAQAQKVVKELDELLEANGVDVKYAIHPVAGRMPGHMNVLLAEADVPYPKLLDLDDANNALPNTDIVVVVGANDVVNPAALDDPGSPVYGMPVLNVWDAKHIIVLKRSMNPGYAGIQNQLFFHDKTRMLFGDAKDSINKVVAEVKTMI